MKMITNYLNTLENYLPEKIQNEIREELESSLIEQVEDKQEALGREITEQEEADLLLKVGHPMRVASAYLPNQELINSDYFPAYKQALTMALSLFAVITMIATLSLNYSSLGIFGNLFSVLFNVIEVSFDVFIVVTGIFFLMQRYGADLNHIYTWDPRKLNSKGTKVSFSRFEVFFEMTFEVLFLVIWNQLFLSQNIAIETSFFESFSKASDWQTVYIPINIIVALSLLINVIKFLKLEWTDSLLITNLANNIAGIFVLIYVLQFEQFVIFDASKPEYSKLSEAINIIEWNITGVIVFIILISLWDSFSLFKKLTKK